MKVAEKEIDEELIELCYGLRPCPFCAGIVDFEFAEGANTGSVSVICPKCLTLGPTFDSTKTAVSISLATIKAIAHWNTRPTD